MNTKKLLLIFIFSYFLNTFSMTINSDFSQEECKHAERDLPQLYIVKSFCLKNEILKALIEYNPTFLETICNKAICKCLLKNLIHKNLLMYNRRGYKHEVNASLQIYRDKKFINDKDEKFKIAEKKLINFIMDRSTLHTPAAGYDNDRKF